MTATTEVAAILRSGMLSIDVEMRCDVMWTRVEEGGGGLSMSKAELPQLAGEEFVEDVINHIITIL